MIEAGKCKKQTISSSCAGENAGFFRNAADYYQNRIHKKIYPLFHFVQEIKKRRLECFIQEDLLRTVRELTNN